MALTEFWAHGATESSCKNTSAADLVKDNRTPTQGPDVGIFSILVDKSKEDKSKELNNCTFMQTQVLDRCQGLVVPLHE